MPRRSVISLLPPTIKRQLDARLRDSAFGDLLGIAAWLKNRGHPVGRSAVGVYALKFRDVIEAAAASQPVGQGASPATARAAAIRLGCLHVAAQTGPAAGLLSRAEAYAHWVLHPVK